MHLIITLSTRRTNTIGNWRRLLQYFDGELGAWKDVDLDDGMMRKAFVTFLGEHFGTVEFIEGDPK